MVSRSGRAKPENESRLHLGNRRHLDDGGRAELRNWIRIVVLKLFYELELAGFEKNKKYFINAVENGNLSHAYLFSGPEE